MKLTFTKNVAAIALLIISFTSCSKTNNPPPGGQTYKDAKGTYVNLSQSDWYTVRQNAGGSINLKLTGTTNADKIVLITYGDGLISDNSLPLDSKKSFTTDAGISFSYSGVLTGEFQASTTLIAYKGSDVFKITLTSGTLKYQ